MCLRYVNLYYEMTDGTWKFEEHTYKYRLVISGRMPNANKDTTYIYLRSDSKRKGKEFVNGEILGIHLSNIKDISFHQAMMASGLSSNMEDYFALEKAVLVEIK